MRFKAAQKSIAKLILSYSHLKKYVDNFMYPTIAFEQKGGSFRVIDINNSALELFNLQKNEIVGKDVERAFPNAEQMNLKESLAEAYKTGESKTYKSRKYQNDQITLWTENYVLKLPSEELLLLFNDKTKEKQTEQELRILLENTNDGYFKWDLKTGDVSYSVKWAEMLGYTRNDTFTEISDWESRIHPADRERVLKNLTEYMEEKKKETLEISYRLERKDGTHASITSKIIQLFDATNNPKTLHNIHVDVSFIEDVRREIQKKVKELERLNNALVGRELKMVELKKRIVELEKNEQH